MKSFWNAIPKPCFVLAPMADITDAPYRKIIAALGKPDASWSEFVSADGLYHTREVQKLPDDENPLMRDLAYTDSERPIVAQIFSGKPEMITYAARLVAELGFDGVDINMGCPDRSVEKQGAGAALIKNPALAAELITAAKDGARAAGHEIPVSVKTRIGYVSETLDEWIPALLLAEPAAITVHLRTRKELSNTPAHWELMTHIVALRDSAGSETLVLGNGDVQNLADAKHKARETGADGIMLGRAIFGNPWLFTGRVRDDIPPAERLSALVNLAYAFEAITPPKHFSIFKKHIKAFVSGFPGAAELRAELMKAENTAQISTILASAPKLL